MQIEIGALEPSIQYKLISSTIVPRPIALITTFSEEKGHNAAPFSFFNAMGEDPPAVVVALEAKRGNDALKDTTLNIENNGQFVVHMVDEAMATAMNVCAIDFPHGVNEATEAGLSLTPCASITPHRIVEAPVAFECEKIQLVQISPRRQIVVGKIVCMHVRDALLDPDNFHINIKQYRPIGRMYGRLYTYTREHFEMAVPDYQEWRIRNTSLPRS